MNATVGAVKIRQLWALRAAAKLRLRGLTFRLPLRPGLRLFR